MSPRAQKKFSEALLMLMLVIGCAMFLALVTVPSVIIPLILVGLIVFCIAYGCSARLRHRVDQMLDRHA